MPRRKHRDHYCPFCGHVTRVTKADTQCEICHMGLTDPPHPAAEAKIAAAQTPGGEVGPQIADDDEPDETEAA